MMSEASDELVAEQPAEMVAEEDTGKPQDQAPKGLIAYRAQSMKELPQVREISREFHSECRYAHLPFSEEKFIRVCSKAISSPEDMLAVYVQHNGKTVGVLNAAVGDYYMGEGGRMVTIYVMYVSGKIRGTFLGGKVGVKLMRMVTGWAKSQKAEEIHIHATSGIEPKRTDKMLTRMGFKTYGGNYVAKLG